MLWNDTLCPEHRSWVMALGTVGIIGTGVAIVGLVQSWALAPLLAVAVALDGVAIGLIDALHDPTRGRLIALVFALAAVLGAAAHSPGGAAGPVDSTCAASSRPSRCPRPRRRRLRRPSRCPSGGAPTALG